MTMSSSIQRGGTTPEEAQLTENSQNTTRPSKIPIAHLTTRSVIRQAKMTQFEALRMERRRKSNRLSARRWRGRQKGKLTELHAQICILQREHAELESENLELKRELTVEIQLTEADSALRTFKPLPDRRKQAHPYPLEKQGWMTMRPSNLTLAQCLLPSGYISIPWTPHESMISDSSSNITYHQAQRYKFPSSFLLSRRLPPSAMNSSIRSREFAKYKLAEILRAATAPSFTF
jgi:hypothetical protein